MIGQFTRVARKLRGRGPAEIRERGEQWFAAWRERHGYARAELAMHEAALQRRLRPGVAADPDTLLENFRARQPAFMPVFDDRTGALAALAAHSPADRTDVLRRATRMLDGNFDFLGYDGLRYGAPIDWQRDPVRAVRAPEVHWSRVPYLRTDEVGDHKVIWEVNRQQYLVTFGQAYWYTGESRWADAFADHVTAWLDANPPKRGINWASSLEVAFRSMSWLWALHFFRDAEALTPALYARMLSALHVHARHLERYLSTYFSPNTHITGEALGLVHIGALAPELAGSARWLRLGLDVLGAWLPRQVRPDGGYFEQSTQYHRYTTEFALHLSLLDDRHAWGLAPWLRPLLRGLTAYLHALPRPDGTMPLIGDDDGGKLIFLDASPPDHLHGVLAQLTAYLGAPEIASVTGEAREGRDIPPAAIWLFGARAVEPLTAPTGRDAHPTSQAFRDTGSFVMRHGSGPDHAHAVIDCGPHGAFNAAHAHADLLSLTLYARGRALIVDSGTYTYSGPERNEFRAAAAHNVVLVDGQGSSEPSADAFQWETRIDGRLIAWESHPDLTYFAGEHDGFARLAGVGTHRRSVLFLHGVGWVVRDHVAASGAHEVRLHWHLAPGLTPTIAPGGASATAAEAGAGQVLRVSVFGMGGLSAEPAWVSARYGRRDRATRLAYTQRQAGAHDVVTFLMPIDDAVAALRDVREVAVRGITRAFVVGPVGGDRTMVGFGTSPDWRDGIVDAFGAAAVATPGEAGDAVVLRLASA